MTAEDRIRWDTRYSTIDAAPAGPEDPRLPDVFGPCEELFPTAGSAIEPACGRGSASVWLAMRGLHVSGFDISPVAIKHARHLAVTREVSGRCRFEPADLDLGLPPGPPVDVVLCHMYRDRRLYRPMTERLKPGGLLAVAVLSEVGAERGPFRAGAGELKAAFGDLSIIAEGEGDGRAWLVATT